MTSVEAPSGLFEELAPALSEEQALLEADRCLECGGPHAQAPCAIACPAGIDVPSFIASIAAGDPAEAAATIFAENLLGGTCARVCPVEALCVGACVLPETDRAPIPIGRLQRYATDWAFAHGHPLRARIRQTYGGKVAVIGAGPAGLACAGELAALGHGVTVFDEREEPGGLVRYAIAPYRQVRDPLPSELIGLRELGIDFRFGTAIDSPYELRNLEDDFDAIVLAIGMGDDVDVRYEGDDLQGVWSSLPFIERIKTGDLPQVGRHVAVIGGGNTAVDVAREALRLGAVDVTLVYRRTEAEMPAYAHEVAEAREEGVHFEFLTVPLRFLGGPRVEAIECRHARLGDPDDSGRRRPEEVPGTEFLLRCDTVVKAIGQRPRATFLSWIHGVELAHGTLAIDESGRTGHPMYFAAGDATNGGATVVEAVRGAKVAARAVDDYVRSEK
jgi:dihydropyrimidine dehydrogenase (NAD+) subunit PreT